MSNVIRSKINKSVFNNKKPSFKTYDQFKSFLTESRNTKIYRDVFNHSYLCKDCSSYSYYLTIERFLINLECDLVSPQLSFSKLSRWFDLYRKEVEQDFNPIHERLVKLSYTDELTYTNKLLDLLVGTDSWLRSLWLKVLSQQVMVASNQGCSAEFIPILFGRQGTGKSRFIAALCDWLNYVPGCENLFLGEVPAASLNNKDTQIELLGRACVELAEIETTLNANSSGLAKAFLTRKKDCFRRPYERNSETFDRYCVFWGTTNDQELLKDTTGNRRFMILPFEFTVEQREEIINYTLKNSEFIWRELFFNKIDYRLTADELFSIEQVNKQFLAKNGCFAEIENLVLPYGKPNWTGTLCELKNMYPVILGNYSINSIGRALKKIPGVQYKKNSRMFYSLCLADRVDKAVLNSN